MAHLIRSATAEDAASIASVQVDTWRSAYSAIMPAKILASLDVERKTTSWLRIHHELTDQQHLLVATVEDSVVGFSSGGPNRAVQTGYDGELYALYVRSEQHKHGIGRALLLASVARLVDVRLQSMLVWVLADNPACGFYEKMGGVRVATKMEDIGGATLEEIAYGWSRSPVSIG